MLSYMSISIKGLIRMFVNSVAWPVRNLPINCKFSMTKDRVMCVEVAGVLSSSSLAAIMALMRYTAGGRADAFCLHLDRSLISIGQEAVDSIDRADEQSISGAIVVRDDTLALAHHYAGRTADVGLVRGVFTSCSDALEWSASQAQLARDQRAWVRARY